MEPSTQLWLLGAPRAEAGGQPIQRFESRKALALLGYLATYGAALPRTQLAALFWPDQPDARGRANLRHMLHTLSAQMPGCLAVDRQTVQFLGAPACWVDTAAFDAFAAQHTLAGLGAAADLYRGTFLDGVYLDDCPEIETWLAQERERWHERVAHVLADLTARSRERQEWAAGLRAVDRLLALDSWREAAHQDKMRLLALSGQRDTALAQYEICRRVLRDELGLDPAPETTALYEQIRDGLLVPPAALAAHRFRVPLPPTPLLGRAAQLAQLAQLLAQPACRLLTLLGPGGVGKTRLALELAAEQQTQFDEGACVVELAAIHDPALVAQTIVQTLGVHASGERTAAERLHAWLGEKQVLLLLDNFEQVLPAAALVRELLAHNPRLTIIVTSRAPLHLRGEQEFLVGPLALPDPHDWSDATVDGASLIGAHAATALFVERAQSVNPRFVVSPEHAPAIAAICVRLDGLPLAIELAAARSKLFAPPALLARLERRLPLLRGSTHDRLPHQQTIRDTIAWSYTLLPPTEQRLFTRLSVFVGGWTLETAEAVGTIDADAAEPLHVVDGIARLVDHSLVQQREGHDSEPRFFMLETIREYALEQLDASPDVADLRQRHAAVFCDIAETARTLVGGARQLEALERLEAEHDNLRAALAYALEQRDAYLALRLSGALRAFWYTRGHVAEGLDWLMRSAAMAERTPTDAYLEVLYSIAGFADFQGNKALTAVFSQELLALARTRADAYWMGMALVSAAQQGNTQQTLATYEAALALFQEVDDTRMVANTLLNMGRTIAFDPRAREQATAYLVESLRLHEAISDHTGCLYVRLHLGLIAMSAGDLPTALEQFQTALQLAWALKNRVMLAYCFDALGGTAVMSGAPRRAAPLLSVAETLRTQLGTPRTAQEQALYAQWFGAARVQLDTAAFDQLWAEGRALSQEQAVAAGLALTLAAE